MTLELIMEKLERLERKVDDGLVNAPVEGIQRTTDPLGRLTIPKEYRKVLGITESTPLEICLVNGALLVRKVEA